MTCILTLGLNTDLFQKKQGGDIPYILVADAQNINKYIVIKLN